MLDKIAVVGAGHVGATTAQRLAEKNLARTVVMIDVVEGIPQGKALDQWQTGPVEGFDSRVIGTNSYAEAEGADLFVVTAGIARKPGMSRDDLVKTNAGIVRSVSEEIKRAAPNAFVVVVSNPLDVMCVVTKETTGFPRERVMGMAGVLDTARYRTFLAEAIGVSVEDIQAMVLGGHGDTMVPLISYTTVSGIPVTQLVDRETLDAIVKRTRGGGAEIVGHMKTGSSYYAPSAAAVQMVKRSCWTRSDSSRAPHGSRESLGSAASTAACPACWGEAALSASSKSSSAKTNVPLCIARLRECGPP